MVIVSAMKQIAFLLLVIFINWNSFGYVVQYNLADATLIPVANSQEESLPDGESEGENKIESLYQSQPSAEAVSYTKPLDDKEKTDALYAENFYELLHSNVFFTPPEIRY